MKSRSTGLRSVAPGVKAEVGTVTFEGKDFSAFGAMLSASHAVGYVAGDDRQGTLAIRTWDGKFLGAARTVASWPIQSFLSDRMFQVEATINGVMFTGRTCGAGMLWRGKRKAVR